MSYCINPDCLQRENSNDLEYCQFCGTPLYISDWYKLLQPLRRPDPRHYTDIFEVDDGGVLKVMKVLKESSPTLVKQFQREAEALQLFHHPGIPKVEDGGYFTLTLATGRELHCLVMEKIEGQNLEQWLAEHGRLSQSQALDWLRQLVEVLHLMHSLDFFHRDIKPSNIMVKPDGQLVLIDFGAVREMTHTYLAKVSTGVGSLGVNTRDITIVTSAGYTPLEQVNGKPVPQSDFYALGRTFAHLLTGKSLFELPDDPTTGKLLWRKHAPHITKPLADFIDELMAPLPMGRPGNTDVILHHLKQRLPRQLEIYRITCSPWFKLATVIAVLTGLMGSYFGARWLLATYYRVQGDAHLLANPPQPATARQQYERSLKLNPHSPVSHSNLALACRNLKDFSCAQDHYQLALALTPDDSAIRYSFASLLAEQDQTSQAIEQYWLAIRANNANPEIEIYARTDLARLYILEGNERVALKLINYSLHQYSLNQTDHEPTKAALLNYRGWIWWNQKRYHKAEQDLQQSLRFDKERAGTYCLLGKIYDSQQDLNRARQAIHNCLRYPSTLKEVKGWQDEFLQRLS